MSQVTFFKNVSNSLSDEAVVGKNEYYKCHLPRTVYFEF